MRIQSFKGKVLLTILGGIAALWAQVAPATTRSEIRAVAEGILKDAHAPVVQGRYKSQAWVSDGWLLIRPEKSAMIEAINSEDKTTVWIDISSLSVVDTPPAIKTAIHLHDGFLLSGVEEPISGQVYSCLVKYDTEGKKKVDLRLGHLQDEGVWVAEDAPAFKIIDGVELPDGRIALYWMGRRDTQSHHVQLGVTFADPDLALHADNFYGPVDLGVRYLRGSSIDDKLHGSGIQLNGKRLYLVDAFSNRLFVFDLQGRELARLDLKDPSGDNRPVVVTGWSVDDSGSHFLVTTREHPGDPNPHFVHELVSYRRDGKVIKSSEMSSLPFVLRGSDTGESFIFIQGSVFKGTIK